MKIPKWTPVAVTWLDAWTEYTESTSKDFEREYKRAIRKTIGWLIVQDKDRIVIAREDDRLHGDSTDCQTITTIPTSMVQTVQILKPVPPQAKRKRAA